MVDETQKQADQDERIKQLYRDGATETPAPLLDARIIHKARNNVPPKRHWLQFDPVGLAPISAAAVIVLGISIVLNIQFDSPDLIDQAETLIQADTETPVDSSMVDDKLEMAAPEKVVPGVEITGIAKKESLIKEQHIKEKARAGVVHEKQARQAKIKQAEVARQKKKVPAPPTTSVNKKIPPASAAMIKPAQKKSIAKPAGQIPRSLPVIPQAAPLKAPSVTSAPVLDSRIQSFSSDAEPELELKQQSVQEDALETQGVQTGQSAEAGSDSDLVQPVAEDCSRYDEWQCMRSTQCVSVLDENDEAVCRKSQNQCEQNFSQLNDNADKCESRAGCEYVLDITGTASCVLQGQLD